MPFMASLRAGLLLLPCTLYPRCWWLYNPGGSSCHPGKEVCRQQTAGPLVPCASWLSDLTAVFLCVGVEWCQAEHTPLRHSHKGGGQQQDAAVILGVTHQQAVIGWVWAALCAACYKGVRPCSWCREAGHRTVSRPHNAVPRRVLSRCGEP
jgi:hypothetical protein